MQKELTVVQWMFILRQGFFYTCSRDLAYFWGLFLKCVIQLQLGNLCHHSLCFCYNNFSVVSKHFLAYEKSLCVSPCWTRYLTCHIGKVPCLASCWEANVSLQIILYEYPSKGKPKRESSLFSFELNFTCLSDLYLIWFISSICIAGNRDSYLWTPVLWRFKLFLSVSLFFKDLLFHVYAFGDNWKMADNR